MSVLGTCNPLLCGIGLLAGDHPLNVLGDLLGLKIVDASALDLIKIHLLVVDEVPVELEGLAQLDDVGRHVERHVILLLLKAHDDNILAFAFDGPSNESPTVSEGRHTLSTTNEDQLVIVRVFCEHMLRDELLEGDVALVLLDAEILYMLKGVADVAFLNKEILEDGDGEAT